MKMIFCLLLIAGLSAVTFAPAHAAKRSPVHGATAKDIDGNDIKLGEKYAGKVMLVVNVASKCGYTKHYKGLQALHEKYAEKGLAVLGFPCNQFGKQEPGSEEDIKEFCEANYGVEFDLYSKIDVNGDNAHALYKYLTSDAAPVKDKGAVKWNFEKFLIDGKGNVIARYRSKVTPAQIAADIEKALAG